MLAEAAAGFGGGPPPASYHGLWPPRPSELAPPWAGLAASVYAAAAELELPVVFTNAGGGRWITPKRAVFPDASAWRGPELDAALASVGLPVAYTPSAIIAGFREANCIGLHFLSPTLLRKSLSARGRSLADRDSTVLALKYCLSDLADLAVTAAALQGLPLIPLADGSYGTFVAASNSQRAVVAATADEAALLGTTMAHMLLDRSIDAAVLAQLEALARSGGTNLQLLSPAVLEEAMPRLLPPAWRGRAAVEWDPEAEGQPSMEWLRRLWAHLAAACPASLDLFGEWPLLPVAGGRLVRLRHNSPVLRDGSWTENVASVLQLAGCQILSLAVDVRHPQIGAYVHDATAAGVLDALAAAAADRPDASNMSVGLAGASRGELRELRGFLLQSKWHSQSGRPIGGLAEKHLAAMRSLRIFECHAHGGEPQLTELPEGRCFFPPPGVDSALLGANFVCCDSERERSIMAAALVVRPVTRAQFYRSHAAKELAGGADRGRTAAAMLRVLAELPVLEREEPEVHAALVGLAFVPTAAGALCTPSSLYDPRVGELQALLDEDTFFPAAEFRGESALATLVSLGLRRELGRQGLLDSACFIEKLAAANEEEAVRRGRALLAHLDGLELQDEAAAAVTSPSGRNSQETLSVLARHAPPAHPGAVAGLSAILIDNSSSIGNILPSAASAEEESFWQTMANTSWCPVLAARPAAAIPWANDRVRIASPKQVRPWEDLWLVSGSMAILDGQCCSRSLRAKLGWEARPNAGVLAGQLVELSRAHSELKALAAKEARPASMAGGSGSGDGRVKPSVDAAKQTLQLERPEDIAHAPEESRVNNIHCQEKDKVAVRDITVDRGAYPEDQTVDSEVDSETPVDSAQVRDQQELERSLDEQIPRIYEHLQLLVGSHDFVIVRSGLQDVPWVWLGGAAAPDGNGGDAGGFASAADLAYYSPAHFKPYLHVVPTHLAGESHQPVSGSKCSGLNYSLGVRQGISLGIALIWYQGFKKLLLAMGVKESFGAADYAGALHRLAADRQGRPLAPDQLELALHVLGVLRAEVPPQLQADSSRQLGGQQVLLPDASSVLAPARDLLFNDAKLDGRHGLDESKVLLSTGSERLVHPLVPEALAEHLGARSLLAQSTMEQATTASLPCMPAGVVAQLLAGLGGADLLLFDLLEVADKVGARKVDFVFDCRQHSRLRLLRNTLGQFQGPAITVAFEGATLTRDEICALQAPPPARLSGHGEACHYGSGLLGAYAVTDLPAVASASALYIFDPSGRVLVRPAGERRAGEGHQPTGLVYSLSGEGADLPKKFPDQFTPFDVHPAKARTWINGTVIRLPLKPTPQETSGLASAAAEEARHAPAPPSDGCGPDSVARMMELLKLHIVPTLLFMRAVEWVTLSVWEAGEEGPEEIFSSRIDPHQAPYRHAFSEKKWKKFQVSAIFGGHNSRCKLQAVNVQSREGAAVVLDRWLVAQSCGAGQTREKALDRRYSAHNLTPVGGVAAHVLRDGGPAPPLPPPLGCVHAPFPVVRSSAGLPVVVLGDFMVLRGGSVRRLFGLAEDNPLMKVGSNPGMDRLGTAWNTDLLACVREAYQELLAELQRVRTAGGSSDLGPPKAEPPIGPLAITAEHAYDFWPRSRPLLEAGGECERRDRRSAEEAEREEGGAAVVSGSAAELLHGVDGPVLVDGLVRPLYARLADMSLWQLHGGGLGRVADGVFLAPPGAGGGAPPAAVGNFLRSHYRVFAVPYDLTAELRVAGAAVKELTPAMLRKLLRTPSVAKAVTAMDVQVDLLDYCCADIHLEQRRGQAQEGQLSLSQSQAPQGPNALPVQSQTAGVSANGSLLRSSDPLQELADFGRAVLDLGRSTIEELSREPAAVSRLGGDVGAHVMEVPRDGTRLSIAPPRPAEVAATEEEEEEVTISEDDLLEVNEVLVGELSGVLLPTASSAMSRLGSASLLVASAAEQSLFLPALGARFVAAAVVERPGLGRLFRHAGFQAALGLRRLSPEALAACLAQVAPRQWAAAPPWVFWDPAAVGPQVPTAAWLRRFWAVASPLSRRQRQLFGAYPLLPAVVGAAGPALVRLDQAALVLVPPPASPSLAAPLPLLTSASQGSADESQGGAETSERASANLLPESARPYSGQTGFDSALAQTAPPGQVMGAPVAESVNSDLRFAAVDAEHPWLLPLLKALGVPVYDHAFLDCPALLFCLPPENKPLQKIVVSKLVNLQLAGSLALGTAAISPSTCDAFFTFLASLLSSTSDEAAAAYDTNEVTVLQLLPIYRTVQGGHSAIDASLHCTIPPGAFLQPGTEYCLQYRSDAQGKGLYRTLGVQELSNADILARFALPTFSAQAERDQEHTLAYIQAHWSSLKVNDAVVAALRETEFVRPGGNDSGARRVRPADLLDPTVELLSRVFLATDRERFPSAEFSSAFWIEVLREAGLQHKLDASLLLECARKVEQLGSTQVNRGRQAVDVTAALSQSQAAVVSPELWSTAEYLVGHVLANFGSIFGSPRCEDLSRIKFVPALKGVPNPHKFGGPAHRLLAAYEEAAAPGDWPLVWAAVPVLAGAPALVPPRFAWSALRLRSPPPLATVLTHLQIVGRNGGENALARWPNASGTSGKTVENAFTDVLKYLDNSLDQIGSSDKEKLQALSFVPVANGTRLVPPSAIYAKLTVDLMPLAFQLPSQYLAYSRCLAALGMREVLTLSGARELLLALQRACGYQRLNPNELLATLKLLQYTTSALANSEQGAARRPREAIAVVPDATCRLVSAAACVYVDSSGARLLCEIDTAAVRFVHTLLKEPVCLRLGVRRLSDVVQEVLDMSCTLEAVDSIGNIHLAEVASQICSDSFVAAAWSAVRDFQEAVPALKDLQRGDLVRALNSAVGGLRFVRRLYTRFVLLPHHPGGQVVDVTRHSRAPADSEACPDDFEEASGGARHRVFDFVDRGQGLIYVAAPPPGAALSVAHLLAAVLSRFLGAPLLPLAAFLDSPAGAESCVRRVLRLGGNFERDMVDSGKSPSAAGEAALGSELAPEDAALVAITPLRPFLAGEIVAWRPDGLADRAPVGNGLRYGRVAEDTRPGAGQALSRVPTEVAPGEVCDLLSTAVLSFKSTAAAALPGPLALAAPEEAVTEVAATSQASAVAAEELRSSGAAKPKPRERQQAVPASEVARAVRDMLAATGLPMGAEQGALLERALALQEQLAAADIAIVLEQRKAEAAVQEADVARANWQCGICHAAEVAAALSPCGHVLCCVHSSSRRCPYCRGPVASALKLFKP
eukprot:SM000422S15899  [mRNA]  locus=s422:514:20866:+ [translate_table: standard]